MERCQDAALVALVVVNGDTIYSTDLDRALMSAHQSMGSAKLMDFDYERLLTRLVNDRLIIQEAAAMGMDEDRRIIDRLRRIAPQRFENLYWQDRV